MKIIRFAITMVFLLPAFQSAHAAEKALFTLPMGTAYTLLDDDQGQVALRIPVQRTDAKSQLGDIELRVIDVVFREGHSEELARAFSLGTEPAGATRGDALILKVKNPALRAGTYNLIVRVSGGAKSAVEQDLTLTLQRNPPQLMTTSTVYVEQVRPLYGDLTEVPGQLRIAENSGLISAKAMQFSDLRDPSVSAAPPAGQLVFSPSAVDVPAGGNRTIAVLPVGQFMLGKTTGKIEIVSTSGSAPTYVPYEVRARRSIAWLLVIALAGAAAGWLIRIWAKGVQQRAAAITAAASVLARLKEAAMSIPDANFRATIDELVNTLKAHAATDEPEAILTLAQAASDNLAKATADLAGGQAALAAELAPWHSLLLQHWRLPDSVMAPLETARAALAEIETFLGARDVARAAVKFSALVTDETLITLIDQVNSCSTALAELARDFVGTQPPVSDAAAAQLKTAGDALLASCPAMSPATGMDIEAVRSALARAHEAYFSAQQLVQLGRSAAAAFLSWAREQLMIEDEALLAPITECLNAGFDRLSSGLDDPVKNRAVALQVASAFVSAWSSLLEDHAARPFDQSIKDLITQGKWVAALQLAATPPADPSSRAGTRLSYTGAGIGPRGSAVAPPGSVAIAAGSSSAAPGASMGINPVYAIRGGLDDLAHLRFQSKLAALLQAGFFSALFLATVTVLYGDLWVGTPNEMLALFVMAFGADLTSDSVLTIAAKLKLPEA